MRLHYDAVCHMSRAGKKVALLEKGQERWPGEYSSESTECLKQYNIAIGLLLDIKGTSLVNTNVALEAGPRVWKMTAWPM
ncbi:20783_t:CDS:2, partial [Cetraspora pellucida]